MYILLLLVSLFPSELSFSPALCITGAVALMKGCREPQAGVEMVTELVTSAQKNITPAARQLKFIRGG